MHESLLRGAGCPQSRDVAAHRASRERSGQRQQQPANPFGGQPRLRAQPLLDLLPPRGQGAGPRRRHPHRRRRPADGPPHRLDIQLQPTGDLLLRHTLHQMQVADLDPLGHPDHLRVLLARSTRRPCLATSIIPGERCFRVLRGPISRGHGVPFYLAATRETRWSKGVASSSVSDGQRARGRSRRATRSRSIEATATSPSSQLLARWPCASRGPAVRPLASAGGDADGWMMGAV